jgi:hypothetical protein
MRIRTLRFRGALGTGDVGVHLDYGTLYVKPPSIFFQRFLSCIKKLGKGPDPH